MNCPKLNTCPKIQVVLDKGYDVPELYAVVAKEVCQKCGHAGSRR